MSQKTLTAEARTERGTAAANRFRKQGRIPAVVYGHNDPIALSLDEAEFYRVFKAVSESTIIALELGKRNIDVLIKDYQEDITTGKILHVDFFEIERGKVLRTHVPITLTGSPIGVREGGVLEHSLYELEIECLPKDMPEHLTIPVDSLSLGHSLHISDIEIPEGVRVLNSPEQAIAVVAAPRAVIDEVEEEEEEEVEEPEEEAAE